MVGHRPKASSPTLANNFDCDFIMVGHRPKASPPTTANNFDCDFIMVGHRPKPSSPTTANHFDCMASSWCVIGRSHRRRQRNMKHPVCHLEEAMGRVNLKYHLPRSVSFQSHCLSVHLMLIHNFRDQSR